MSSPVVVRSHVDTTQKHNPKSTTVSLPDIPEILALSLNGKHLVVGFFDNKEIVHFDSTGQPRSICLEHSPDKIAVADDGTVVTSCLNSAYTIWQLAADKAEHFSKQTIPTASWVKGVAISRSGELVATGREDGSFSIRKRTDAGLYKRDMNRKIDGAITAITLTPSGFYLALGTKSGALHLFNVGQQTFQSRFDMQSEIISMALSSDGSRLFARDIGNATGLWGREVLQGVEAALTEGDQYALITGKGAKIMAPGKEPVLLSHQLAQKIYTSLDGTTTVTLSHEFVKIWTRDGQSTHTIEGEPKSRFTQAVVSGDGRRVVLADDSASGLTIIDLK